MKGTKTRTVNTLGMFDLFKGIGMATVILAHTTESYSLSLEGGISVFGFVLFIYREALMSAFYIASGYGFRKRSLGKCVRQQLKGILPPFLYTALATAVCVSMRQPKPLHTRSISSAASASSQQPAENSP